MRTQGPHQEDRRPVVHQLRRPGAHPHHGRALQQHGHHPARVRGQRPRRPGLVQGEGLRKARQLAGDQVPLRREVDHRSDLRFHPLPGILHHLPVREHEADPARPDDRGVLRLRCPGQGRPEGCLILDRSVRGAAGEDQEGRALLVSPGLQPGRQRAHDRALPRVPVQPCRDPARGDAPQGDHRQLVRDRKEQRQDLQVQGRSPAHPGSGRQVRSGRHEALLRPCSIHVRGCGMVRGHRPDLPPEGRQDLRSRPGHDRLRVRRPRRRDGRMADVQVQHPSQRDPPGNGEVRPEADDHRRLLRHVQRHQVVLQARRLQQGHREGRAEDLDPGHDARDPHTAEELWESAGFEGLVSAGQLPEADPR